MVKSDKNRRHELAELDLFAHLRDAQLSKLESQLELKTLACNYGRSEIVR